MYEDPVLDGGLTAEVSDRVDSELRRVSFLHEDSNVIGHERLREVENPLTY